MRLTVLVFLSTMLLACTRSGSVSDRPNVRAPIGTFSRVTMMRRVLEGGVTTSGTEVLIVYSDRSAEIRDRDANGVVIKKASVEDEPFVVLEKTLASSEWSSLPREQGKSVPDGAVHTIEVRGFRVTRHDDPADELVVRQAVATFEQIWAHMDP